jgi:hypothetical protein
MEMSDTDLFRKEDAMTEMTMHECELLQMARNHFYERMPLTDSTRAEILDVFERHGAKRWRSAENAPIMQAVIRMVLAWKIAPSKN